MAACYFFFRDKLSAFVCLSSGSLCVAALSGGERESEKEFDEETPKTASERAHVKMKSQISRSWLDLSALQLVP